MSAKHEGGVQAQTRTFLAYQGTYSSSTTYTKGDTVSYNGNIYVSLIPNNTGNTPSTNPTMWAAFGATGPAGPTGPVGGWVNTIACSSTVTLANTAAINAVQLSCNITNLTVAAGNSNSTCFVLEFFQAGGYSVTWNPIFRTSFKPGKVAGTFSSGTECWDNTNNTWYLSGIPMVNQ